MSGALHRHMARGWAAGGRVRGYVEGGAADPAPEDDPYSGLPPPQGGAPPVRVGALSQANADDVAGPQPGALGQSMPSGGGASPDQQDPNAQRKMFDMNRAMSILRASQGVNPMIAAAGAMLAPTHTGGFSESLGAGLTAYGRGAEQERATDEQMAERLLQAQWQNDYRQAVVGVQQQKANTGSDLAAARIPLMSAQTGMDMAHAALFNARAALGAASHVTPGDLQAQAMNSLLTPGPDGSLPINPDTQRPWQKIEAFQATQAATAAGQGVAERGGVAAARMAQNQALIDARVQALQGTADYHNQLVALKAQGLSDAAAKAQLDAQIRQQQADAVTQNAATNATRVDQNAPLVDARIQAIQGTQDYRNQLLVLKAQGMSDAAAKAKLDTDIRQQQVDIANRRVDQQQPLVDAKVQSYQDTKEYHDSVQAMHQQGVPFAQAVAAGKLAASIMAAKPGTTWPQAFAQAREGLPGAVGQPAPAVPQAVRPAAPAATPAAPAPQQTPPAGYPNARWSGKYGSWLIPGDAPGSWRVVGGGQAAP